MNRFRALWLVLAMLLAATSIVFPYRVYGTTEHIVQPVVVRVAQPALDSLSLRPDERTRPALSNDAFIRPEFAREMRALRPTIIAAAQRHNRRVFSGMTDHEFAVVLATLLYNEHSGWLEEEVTPLRSLTPFYESLQVQANHVGANLSVWPANIRPSVAAEILQGHIPLPGSSDVMTRTIVVSGSHIIPKSFASQNDLYTAISREIADPRLAVEYLAANLERGLYRAWLEDVPVTWRALAAWHNQGIVGPAEIAANPTAASYVRRSSAYLPAAFALINGPNLCRIDTCTLAETIARRSEWMPR